MQTFLPYADFEKTVKCLDYRRLGKERLEAMQIHKIITGTVEPGKNGRIAWLSHPCVKMWRGYENALATYHNFCIYEWIDRGYKNTMEVIHYDGTMKCPPWIGDERFHSSHRQTLLFKNFEWYSQFGWNEKPKYEYFWPTKSEDYSIYFKTLEVER